MVLNYILAYIKMFYVQSLAIKMEHEKFRLKGKEAKQCTQ